MTEKFEWPCAKRIAHGEHEIEDHGEVMEYGRSFCPGVAAHPATLIGGALPEEMWNDRPKA